MKAAAELIAGALESMPLAPSSVPRSAPQRPHHQWPPRSHAAHALRMHSTTPLHVPINQISQGWLAAQICRVGRPEQEELSHRQSPDMSGPPCLATTPDAAHHLPFVDDSGTAWIEWREAVEVCQMMLMHLVILLIRWMRSITGAKLRIRLSVRRPIPALYTAPSLRPIPALYTAVVHSFAARSSFPALSIAAESSIEENFGMGTVGVGASCCA